MASHHGRDKNPTMYIPIVKSWIFRKGRQRNKGEDVGSATTDPDNKNGGKRLTLVISGRIKGPAIIYRRGEGRRILG